MKKLLFVILLFSTNLLAQTDPYIFIGQKAKIRYDSDSNMIKFSTLTGSPVTLRIGTEYNLPLFNFNSSQFNWSSGKLNLNATANPDSLYSKVFSILKDTSWNSLGDIVSKWKVFSLKKPNYFNYAGFYDLKWFYKEVNVSGTTTFEDSIFSINDAVSHSANYLMGLDGTYNIYDTLILPVRGKYLVNFSVIYEFVPENSITSIDSISIRMKDLADPTQVWLTDPLIVTHLYDTGFQTGERRSLTWSFIRDSPDINRKIVIKARDFVHGSSLIHNLLQSTITATLLR